MAGHPGVQDVGLSGDQDRIELIDLLAVDVQLERIGNDLHIKVLAGSDTLRIVNHFSSQGTGIEQLEFANGEVWDRTMIQQHSVYPGTGGSNNLVGTAEADVFLSSAGDDVVDGKEGGDTYYHASGDGHDQFVDTGVGNGAMDALYLTDLLRTDVSFARTAEDVLITDNGTQQVIRLTGQFTSSEKGLERLIFADGEEWNRQAMQANITVFVGALNGTSANDTLNGTSSNNVLIGREGNDLLYGLDGSDTYVFTRGDGQDTIDDNGYLDTDVLRLYGYTPGEVLLGRSGATATVVLTFAGTTDKVTLVNQINNTLDTIEQIQFDDGTLWNETYLRTRLMTEATTPGNDSISGFTTDDVLVGRLGNDLLYGLDGSDTYVFTRGDGQDTIDDNGYLDTDVLQLHGYTPGEVLLGRSGAAATVVLTFAGTTDKVTLVNQINNTLDTIEQIQFDDGSVWTELGLRTRVITGTANGETLTGTANSDLLTGLGGADVLTGGAGNDTFVFRGLPVGHDTITDFSGGVGLEDLIEIETFDSFDGTVE